MQSSGGCVFVPLQWPCAFVEVVLLQNHGFTLSDDHIKATENESILSDGTVSVNLKKKIVWLSTHQQIKVDIVIKDIERKSYIKYLGIFIDKHLTWEPQIKHISNKIAKNVGIITKLQH